MRNAIITAATVEVSCPYCREPAENPDNGAHSWTAGEVRAQAAAGGAGRTGVRTCAGCDELFRIVPQSRVSVPTE